MPALGRRVHRVRLVQSENVQVFGDKLQQFFSSTPTEGEDIFKYITRMSACVKDIERLNEVLGTETVRIPNFIIVWKIFQAVRMYPHLEFFFKFLLVQKPREWLTLTPAKLMTELSSYSKNTRDLDSAKPVVNAASVPRPSRPPPPDPKRCLLFFF